MVQHGKRLGLCSDNRGFDFLADLPGPAWNAASH